MRRIVAASTRLFQQQGFDRTTVQQIADEADVAVGTLFLYVLDKGEILLLLYHNAIEQQLKKAAAGLRHRRPLMPAVTKFLMELMIPYEKDLELSRVFWREFLFHKGKVREQLDMLATTTLQVLRDRIAAARDVLEINASVDPDAAALQIYAIYHATLAFHLAGCLASASPRQTIDVLLLSMWRGLEPRVRSKEQGNRKDHGRIIAENR